MQDVHYENRMTRAGDHDQYLDLWWSSLHQCFREMKVSSPVMQAWRRAYATYRARRGPKWKAVASLTSWVIRQPSQLRVRYGHFDLTLRNIFQSGPGVIRLLSFKNRLLARDN
jgi:hypothetical protein